MKFTPKLKGWLLENTDIEADASDSDFRDAAAEALTRDAAEGEELTSALLEKLTADEDADKGNTLLSALTAISDGQKLLLEKLAEKNEPVKSNEKGKDSNKPPETDIAGNKNGWFENALSGGGDNSFGNSSGAENVRLKGAHESYSGTKSAAIYPDRDRRGRRYLYAGQRVFEGGDTGKRYIDEASELETAQSGAYLKWVLSKGGTRKDIPWQFRMTDHDRDLMNYTLRNSTWGGTLSEPGGTEHNLSGQRLTELQIKAIGDEAVSGGLAMAPIFFDDQVILTPLLHGELFPLVNLVNITRGRRIESATIGNPTMAWGGGDDTAVALFNTAAFVAAFDTTIHVVDGAIEVGLDFLTDSPINVGAVITQSYGERLMRELDEQIAIGDGATEPEGIMVAAGTTDVAFGGVAPTIGAYLTKLFSVTKEFKAGTTANRIVWCSNETTYRRARAIAVGAADARLVHGMAVEDYTLFGRPYAIDTTMANTQGFFANMSRYRMYRRLGLTVDSTTEGSTLKRRNEWLIIARARFGGQLEDSNAAAVSTTMQA